MYDEIIRSYRWQSLRRSYIISHPVCEDCEMRGRTSVATEVHHIVPIETATSREGMEALAYDPGNLRSLCHDCHVAEHVRLGSNGKKGRRAVREGARDQAEAFVRSWCGSGVTEAPGV